MITKDKLAAANTKLETMDIKGGNYATVAARVNAFREVCPGGTIDTQILEINDDHVVMQAKVYDEDNRLLASGTARENRLPDEDMTDAEKRAFKINKTSYVENCETSAVGRALGNLGIGSEQNIRSAEEMVSALMQQNELLPGKRVLTIYCNEHALTLADVTHEHELDTVQKGLSYPYYKAVAEMMEERNE